MNAHNSNEKQHDQSSPSNSLSGGLCRDCVNWEGEDGYGHCHKLTLGTGNMDRCRVYEDSMPIGTEENFGCVHFSGKPAAN